MLRVDIICVARVKKGAHLDLIHEYQKRMQWPLNIIEVESKQTDASKRQIDEQEKIQKHLSNQAVIIALDERGQNMKSLDFAKKLESFAQNGQPHIQFIIGGADGLTQNLRDQSNLLISFGKLTWPHLLARVMLLEQIYRAQQILAGHPYHRE